MIIVTGGAGFIGSVLVQELKAAGHKNIVVVDRMESGSKWLNLQNTPHCDFVHADRFFDWSEKNTVPLQGVFHLGACSSTEEKDVDYLMENNFEYSKKVALYCEKHNVPFVYASSAATYGNGGLGFSDHPDMIPHLKPLNPYGYSKQLFDRWLTDYRKEVKGDWNWYGLKYFNVFGPNEYHKGSMQSVVCKAAKQIKETGQLKLFKSDRPDYADGQQSRDFIYVKDAVKVTKHFFDHHGDIESGIYNVGTGEAHSFLELAEYTFKSLKIETKIDWIPTPKSIADQYQYFTQADASRLREVGKYKEAFMDFDQSLQDYVENYLSDAEFRNFHA